MLYRFENPQFLYAFLPLLILTARMWWKKKKEPYAFSMRRFVFLQTAFVFCILGLMRPQMGTRSSNEISSRSNLFIALDVSQSMLANDITPSRMGFAVNFAQKLLQKAGDLRVAIYPFTTDGYLMMPLSTDLYAAADLLNSLHPSMTTGQGSNLSVSLVTLLETIKKAELSTKAKDGEWAPTAVLFLSDGESHHPLDESILKGFRQNKIPIHAVVTGTAKPVQIPDENKFSGQIGLRDPSSNTPILTKASPENMMKIAKLTGGDFFESRFSEVDRVSEKLKRSLSLGKIESSFKLEKDFYPVCFLIVLLLLSAELLFGRWEYALKLLPLFFLLVPHTVNAEENLTVDAYDKYNEGVKFLTGKNFNKAIEAFVDSGYAAQDQVLKKKALYNLGNAFLESGDPTQAILAYQQARDVGTKDKAFDADTNKKISENMVLASKQEQMQQQSQSQPKEGEGEGDPKEGQDSNGPKQFQGDPLSEGEKKKLYEAVADEERQTLSRLRREQNRKASNPSEKPW